MKKEKQPMENTPQEPQTKRIVINIERYQHLLEALDDKKKIRRIRVSIAVIGILLFFAIALIMLSLKSFFPYSDISTNAFGTTTIANEEKQVSYFLFNTAELWANSGIVVEKGDIISIHSSGTANTAIHHIDKASRNNIVREKNFGPLGERQENEKTRDLLRSKYRVFPSYPQSALIMQVASEKAQDLPSTSSEQNFYYIGAQRDNIHIVEGGTLYFAVNDIVLDKPTILKMMLDNIAVMAELERKASLYKKPSIIRDSLFAPIQQELLETVASPKDSDLVRNLMSSTKDTIYRENIRLLEFRTTKDKFSRFPTIIQEQLNKNAQIRKLYNTYMVHEETFHFGGYETQDYSPTKRTLTEMDYYWKYNYKQAWYDDNVGSFLILVEKENKNRLSHGE